VEDPVATLDLTPPGILTILQIGRAIR